MGYVDATSPGIGLGSTCTVRLPISTDACVKDSEHVSAKPLPYEMRERFDAIQDDPVLQLTRIDRFDGSNNDVPVSHEGA